MLKFQRYPPNDFCTARYERKSFKKTYKLFENPEENNFWADLANVCSKRRDSESWTDIDRQSQRLRHGI